MVKLGDDKVDPVTFEKMRDDIGTAMPARKAVQGPAPSMPRLAASVYQEPRCDTASDWVSQLPLAMVATLIPSKKVHLHERNGVTGVDAIRKEYANLESMGFLEHQGCQAA
jgi:hypothetical protein